MLVSKTYDIENFYKDLVAHGLIIPVGVQGAHGRNKVFESIVNGFNGLIDRISAQDGAEEMWFPPVINRKIIEKVHYLESFPHLCGAVHSFFGNELESKKLAAIANEGGDWGSMLKMTDVALSPAACYPVYPACTGTVPRQGRLVSITNYVFRHEPSPEPTRMQSFRMREFIRIGTMDQVVEWRDAWLQKGIKILQGLGLPAQSDIANDPFFGRGGRVLAAGQREQRLKFEVLVPVISAESPTACCSFNFHQEHFGEAFEIRTEDGAVANTACLGFGLERLTLALLKEHGFDPGKWPSEVQKQLWP
jgi:seryl-tRNA synthetase